MKCVCNVEAHALNKTCKALAERSSVYKMQRCVEVFTVYKHDTGLFP